MMRGLRLMRGRNEDEDDEDDKDDEGDDNGGKEENDGENDDFAFRLLKHAQRVQL